MKATGPYYWDEVRQGTPQKIPLRVVGYEEKGQRHQPRTGDSNWGDVKAGDAGRNSVNHRQDEGN